MLSGLSSGASVFILVVEEDKHQPRKCTLFTGRQVDAGGCCVRLVIEYMCTSRTY